MKHGHVGVSRYHPDTVVFRNCGSCGIPIQLRLTPQGYRSFEEGSVRHLCRHRQDHPWQRLLPLGPWPKVG